MNDTSHPQGSVLAVLPLRRGVLLPASTTTIPVGRSQSIALARAHAQGGSIAVAVQRDPAVESPLLADLHDVATVARVRRVVEGGGTGYRMVLEGIERVRLEEVVSSRPYLSARVSKVVEPTEHGVTAGVLADELRKLVGELASDRGIELPAGLLDEREPGRLADRIGATLDLEPERKISILLTADPAARLRLVAELVKELEALWDLRHRIGSEVRREIGKEQRRAILQQQLRAIRRELGETSDEPSDELRKRLEDADLPQEVRETVERELGRLDGIGPNSPEHHVIRTYLELIADLPWSRRAELSDDVDLVAARLDRDHHGLDDVKRRILEHLAVAKLSGDVQGTILCLVGPPGVGKTSLAQSVAEATGRPLVRVSLGGVRDEAEIRGHRRTYVGALPGRIVSALRRAKVKNPVVVLDEVDKLGNGFWGSPEAALLELLDPEQNRHFTDHYLELPFDLSEVMFVATANTLDTLSPPLRDRLEIIELSGYTTEEKVLIARKHLIDRRLDRIGLAPQDVEVTDAAVKTIIEDYTREAGVRQLDRQIAKLLRGVALAVVRGKDEASRTVRIDAVDVPRHLGRRRHHNEVAERVALPGVATGLAWTPVGGDILFIETSRMRGTGNLQITGKLGDVMQESARAALTYVRSHADELGIDPDFLRDQDIHVHVPSGAVPKDGPSAGVTIFTALTSLLSGRRVRSDTAMTGECSLRGRVLPVGGIKEKVAAAHRAGLSRVILPRRNEADIDDVPKDARDAIEFILVDDMSEVLDAALEPVPVVPGHDLAIAASG